MADKKLDPQSQKPKNAKRALLEAVKYCKPFIKPIIGAVILTIVSSALAIICPGQLKILTDAISNGLHDSTGGQVHLDMNLISFCSIVLVVLYVINAICSYFNSWLMIGVVTRLSQQLRQKISVKINRLPLKYFDNTTIGDVLSRITNDVDTISSGLTSVICPIISSLILLVGSLIIMLCTHLGLALTAIISSLIGLGVTSIILSKSQKYFTEYQSQLGAMNGHIEESFSGHHVIKACNAESEMQRRFHKINHSLFNSSRNSQFYSGILSPIMGFVGNIGYVAVCVSGSILVFNGEISFGVVIAFMAYIGMFMQPLTQFASIFASLQPVAAAAERISTFFNETEMPKESHQFKYLSPEKVKGHIEFDNVKFGYKSRKPVIKNFSAKVKPNQKVAIVGPTGAGKTTLVNLLMKFYDINSGDIKIDGVSIKEMTRDNIRQLFTMVLQDTWLFNGTIQENLRFNNKNITDEQIKEACKLIGVDHFVNSLPNGYDTLLNDVDELSAGQKQLLTIARAIIDDAPLLILDEATSSVDTRTEELVQKAMDKLSKNRTSFVIAHRLSTIKNADIILVMKNGNIIEQGNHKALMAKNGFYADLYNSQFSEG